MPSAPVPLLNTNPEPDFPPPVPSDVGEEAPEDVTAPQKVPPELLRADAKEASDKCARCGSGDIAGNAMLGDASGSALVLRLSNGTRAAVSAGFCGSCGDIRLTVAGAAKLYEALRGSL
jgi:hypothetical protein